MSQTDQTSFLKLTPNSTIENDIYFDALDFSLGEPDIKNIAITGPYGSGKSSVLESYISKKKIDCLNISLASFCVEDIDEINKDSVLPEVVVKGKSSNSNPGSKKEEAAKEIVKSKEDIEREVEKNIIQQIFFQLKPEDTIYSKIERVKSFTSKERIQYSFLLLVVFVSSLWIPFAANNLKSNVAYINKNGFGNFWNSISWGNPLWMVNFISIITVLIAIYYLIHFLVYYSRKGQIKKVKISSNEIELKSKESYLTSNLDELIYLFTSSGKKIVIIEDLDRFESLNLFTKLRELNIVLNQCPEIKETGVVKFVYAIRDDLFKDSHQRTKFFDFILPIVPYVNSNNSRDKLLDLLKDVGFDKDNMPINKKFIKNIGFYIYDMRLLANVVNEFKVYIDKINISIAVDGEHKVSHKPEDVFSMILYKNLFPDDFNKLHQNEGLLWDIFNTKKQKLVHIKNSELDKKIISVQDSKQSLEAERKETIKELQKEYIFEILKESHKNSISHFNSSNQTNIYAYDLQTGDNFEEVIQSGLLYTNRQGRQKSFDYKSIEVRIDPNNTYIQRREKISLKQKGEETKLDHRITEIKKLKKKYNQIGLRDLIREINMNDWKEVLFQKGDDEIYEGHSNDLLIYLIRNGYIDENYYHNISIFHEGSLNKSDYEFVMNVKNWKSQPFDLPLSNIENILEEIDGNELTNDAALNFSLMSYLIKKLTGGYLELLLKQFTSESLRADKFIESYIDHLQQQQSFSTCKNFIILLLPWHHNFWNFVEYVSVKPNAKRYYIQLLLNISHLPITDFERISYNSGADFKDYIEQEPRFLHMFEDMTESHQLVCELISKLDIKFSNLKTTNKGNKLYDYICNNNNYEINLHNLFLMFLHGEESKKEIIEAFEKTNYTCILLSNKPKVIEYLHNNLNAYCENILFKLPPQEDNSHAFCTLLNTDVSFENKVKLINRSRIKVKYLHNLKDELLYVPIVMNNKMESNWENINSFANPGEEMPLELVNFLNSKENSVALSEKSIAHAVPNEAISLTQNIVDDVRIFDKSIEKILKKNTVRISNFEPQNISEARLKILIEYRVLPVDEETYNALIAFDNDAHIDYLEKEINLDNSDVIDFKLEPEDLIKILNRDISKENKVKIISNNTKYYVRDVSRVPASLYNALLLNKVVEPNWKNVWLLFKTLHTGFTEDLISFTENSIEELTAEKVAITLKRSEEEELGKAILFSNKFDPSTIEKLIKLFDFKLKEFPKGTTYEVVDILIDNNILELNETNYTSLKRFDVSFQINVLRSNISDYFEKNIKLSISIEDYVAILNDSRIEEEYKIRLVEQIKLDKLLISDDNIFPILIEYVIDKDVRSKDFDFIQALLSLDFDISEKVKVINHTMKNFKPKEIMILLNILPNDYKIIPELNEKHAKLSINTVNKDLATLLKFKNLIKSYVIEKDTIRVRTKNLSKELN